MKVFIGSSQESLSFAERIALMIEEAGHVPILWNSVGLFTPNHYTFESLEKICRDVGGAIFVFNEDDKIWYREGIVSSVRDNVLIEYGLFCGHLSRNNVCFCRVNEAKLASDISGVTYINLNQMQRAQMEIKSWLTTVAEREISPKTDFKVMSFLDAFYYAVGTKSYIQDLRIFSVVTYRVAPIFKAKANLKIENASVFLKSYGLNSSFYDDSLKRKADLSIEIWEEMKNSKHISNLEIIRYDFQPNDGFYIIDDSVLIYANIFVDSINNKISFDDSVLLVENRTKEGKMLINCFINKFESFKMPYKTLNNT